MTELGGLAELSGIGRIGRIGWDLQEGLTILPPSLHCGTVLCTEAAHVQCTNIVFKYLHIVNNICAQCALHISSAQLLCLNIHIL